MIGCSNQRKEHRLLAFRDRLPEKVTLIHISFLSLCHRLTDLNFDLNRGLIGHVSVKLQRGES
jgi:hypothetical protein